MEAFRAKAMPYFAIDPEKPDEKNSRAIDVSLKCPNCHLAEVYGVAVSHEAYERIMDVA
jgi:hypothetical protein